LSQWFSERSLEPQLPLYSLAHGTSVSGLIFAILSPEKTQYQGLVKKTDQIQGGRLIEKFKSYGAEATWESQQTKWEMSLSQLVADFKQGVATVDPKQKEQSCRYCHLQ